MNDVAIDPYPTGSIVASANSASEPHAELYRHDKTGGVYEVICNATHESTGEMMVVYRNQATGERWARPAAEFNDGRFTRIKVG